MMVLPTIIFTGLTALRLVRITFTLSQKESKKWNNLAHTMVVIGYWLKAKEIYHDWSLCVPMGWEIYHYWFQKYITVDSRNISRLVREIYHDWSKKYITTGQRNISRLVLVRADGVRTKVSRRPLSRSQLSCQKEDYTELHVTSPLIRINSLVTILGELPLLQVWI